MALSVAIQMDPIERIDIKGDSTFALALEAQARGHTLFYYGPRDLTFRDGAVTARMRPLEACRFFLESVTGAATTRFCVKTAAAAAGRSEKIIARSSPAFFKPHRAVPARKPFGAVTESRSENFLSPISS